MCYVTSTELKNNLSYYLERSNVENVYVTKNNKVISVLCNPALKALDEIIDFVEKNNIHQTCNLSDEEIITEEIEKRWNY